MKNTEWLMGTHITFSDVLYANMQGLGESAAAKLTTKLREEAGKVEEWLKCEGFPKHFQLLRIGNILPNMKEHRDWGDWVFLAQQLEAIDIAREKLKRGSAVGVI